jgi:uncharacterized protein involved in response to NO
MRLAGHALWLAGFRPFFLLACIAGLALPIAWTSIYTGGVPPALTFALPPVQWHGHEMFYGFGMAVLGGFLLTATKNWVGVRGWHGGALIFLAVAWLLDRVAISFGAGWPTVLFWPAVGLFQAALVGMLLHTLLQQKVRGGASDNYFFWIALPLFLPAKFLIVQGEHFVLGWSMSIALFRLAFLLMLERTQVQYMRHGFGVDILRNPSLDLPIKWLAVALAFAELLPAPLAGLLEFVLATLLLWRFAGWYPRKAFTWLDIGVMYFGYLMIVVQLIVSGIGRFVDLPWVGTVAVHLFAVGVMGAIIPAMIVRIAKGHTGRDVVFERADKVAVWIMVASFIARVVAPQFHPAGYAMWLHIAAACWLVAFAILLWHYMPFLLASRIDGREH